MFVGRERALKLITKYFLKGLLSILPVGLTVYVVSALIIWSERLSRRFLEVVVGESYLPGLGLVVAATVIVLLGFVVSQPIFNRFFFFLELPFRNVPLVRNVYSAIKNLSDYFSPKNTGGGQKVVVVKWPGANLELIGFLTNEDLKLNELDVGKKVAVYFPLSYQIGGYTCFIPRSWVREIDMPVEKAMAQSLTAWMPKNNT